MDFFPWPMVGNVIQLVGYGLFFFVGWLWRAHKSTQEEDRLIKEAVCALVRDRLVHKYEKCIAAGWCSVEYLADIQGLYDTYTRLGGNGVVPGLMDRIRSLPTERPDA